MPVVVLLISLLLIAADQWTKYLVDLHLKPIGSIEVIKNFFSLDYLENRGAALGILQDQRWVFIILTSIICLAMLVFLFKYKKHNFLSYASLCLIFAGGVGNLIDRIERGYVIDFLYVHFFPYRFNLADCCVTIGAVLFMLTILFFDKQEKAESKHDHAE